MAGRQRIRQWAKVLMWLVPGAWVLGSSCASDIQDSLRAAGMDFVEESAGQVLGELLPVDEWLSGGST